VCDPDANVELERHIGQVGPMVGMVDDFVCDSNNAVCRVDLAIFGDVSKDRVVDIVRDARRL